MPTIIDSLVMMLGLDASGIKKGGKEAREEIDKTKKKGGELNTSFKDLKKSAGEFLMIIGSAYAIKKFVVEITDADAIVSRLSRNLGINTATLSSWEGAAQRFGGTAAEMQGTMKSLSMEITNMQLTGESRMLPYLRALGVHIADANGKALPLDNILLQISDKLSRLDRTTAYNIAKMMGLDEGTINLLLSGRKEMEKVIQRQKELGIVNQEGGRRSEELQAAWVDFGLAFKGIARDITEYVTPTLITVFGWLSDTLKWFHEHKAVTVAVFSAIAAVLIAILFPAVVSVTGAIWGLTAAFFASPVGWITALIMGLVAAFNLLIEDYNVWAQNGKSAFDWTWFANSIEIATEKLQQFQSWIKKTTEAWKDWLRARGLLPEEEEQTGPTPSPKGPKPSRKGGAASMSGRTTTITDASGNVIERRTGGHRNWRNNNPGNIEWGPFARAHGAIGGDPRFAIFRTMEEGYAAADALLKAKSYRNRTIAQAVERWAPRSENDTDAYINAYRQAGFNVNQRYSDLSPAEQRRFLQTKMRIEGGRQGTVSRAQASAVTPAVSARAIQAEKARVASVHNSRSSNVDTRIGQVVVYTSAQDGKGIGNAIRQDLSDNGLINQMEYGIA